MSFQDNGLPLDDSGIQAAGVSTSQPKTEFLEHGSRLDQNSKGRAGWRVRHWESKASAWKGHPALLLMFN